MKRRQFIKISTAAGMGTILANPNAVNATIQKKTMKNVQPIVISSGNGLECVKKAYAIIQQGNDALDAVIAGVNIVENDPNDHSVGYGGLPNEDGVVELDSCCMHGPTHNAGAVAALQNIRNPSKVARLVMERTDHVLLVGEGALKFAKMHGFKEEELLTDAARAKWMEWKENVSDNDDWFPPVGKKDKGHSTLEHLRPTGTINCNAIDLEGNISGVTTTSGLAYKIPGRVGDSPVIGAGLYVDNEVGACGSTGRGEENLKNLSSFMVVEYMRMGKSPKEACKLICKRIIDHAKAPGLKFNNDVPDFNVAFYAINKNGEYGSFSIKGPIKFTVCDAKGPRQEECDYLYKW